MTPSDAAFFARAIKRRPSAAPPRLISDYIEGRRIMPSNTPFPGPWQNSRTPYWVEIMDSMSPFSPIQHGVLVKARKMGGTTGVLEPVAAYWTDAYPTDWAYVSASEPLVKDWSERKFDNLIDSMGFRDKITAQGGRGTHRSGDTGKRKEWAGGAADFYSISSKIATRAQDKRLLLRDEIDAVDATMNTGEGNRFEINKGHTNSWGSRRKIMDISSPTTFERSIIWAEYLLGDCRQFLVPCPLCGHEQPLDFEFSESSSHGMRADTEAGQVVRAYYLCDHCHDAIFNTQKTEMLKRGHWEGTKKSCDPTYASWQINALYAPVGMISWTEIYKEYLKAQDDPSLRPSFQNTLGGLPFRETGTRPALQTVLSLRGDYQEFTVPDGVLYVTAGIDVQAGQSKDPDHPARLEMHVVGHGLGYRRWSIGYYVFPGATDNAFDGAWQKLVEWFAAGKGMYRRSAMSKLPEMTFPISIIFIDSGNRPDVTYQFCTRGSGMFPVKGMPLHAMVADSKRREAGQAPGGYVYYRYARVSDGQMIYELNVSLYKKGIYADLSRSGAANRQPGPVQRTSFFDFPQNYGDEFFRGLASEEELPDGSYRQVTAHNEALDTTVYAVAAAHIYLDGIVKMIQEGMRKQGANIYQLQQVGSRAALDYLAARIGSPPETAPAPAENNN